MIYSKDIEKVLHKLWYMIFDFLFKGSGQILKILLTPFVSFVGLTKKLTARKRVNGLRCMLWAKLVPRIVSLILPVYVLIICCSKDLFLLVNLDRDFLIPY